MTILEQSRVERSRAELDNCNFVKTVLMVLIVFYHSIVYWNIVDWFVAGPSSESKVLSVSANLLNSFHIYAFALVSGFIYYAMRYEKRKYQSFLPFVKNKALRLLVPYCSVVALWIIPHYIGWYKPSATTVISRYFLMLSPNQAWFLLMLFWVFAIVYPISKLIKEHLAIGIIISAGLYLLSAILPIPNYFQFKTGLKFIVFFVAGFYFREYEILSVFKREAGIVCLAVIGLIFVATFSLQYTPVFTNRYAAKAVNVIGELIMNLSGAIFAFASLQLIGDKINSDNVILKYGSKYSMLIYLFHQQVIQDMLYLLRAWTNPFIVALVCFFVSITLSTIMAALVNRNRVLRFAFTGKR